MKIFLRLIAILSFLVAILWVMRAGMWEPEPVLAFLGGLTSLALSFTGEKKENRETLDERNRRVMLDHVENFWVRGILEKSLHGAALLELGIKEEPGAVRYPWTVKKEATDEPLPAGKGMLEIFREIGAGRSLLILGAPGAGKTTMLLELARQSIPRARAQESEPLPVVFNLASWTEKLTLADWLAEQLNLVYYVPKKIAPAWVEGDKMLLLLDGLDEVKAERRERCVEALNQFRTEHGLTPLVVCSRVEEYRAIKTRLAFEGAITLQPLTSEQVDAYIDRFGNSLASVRLLLRKDQALQELAETPLTLSIMALAYKDVNAADLPASEGIEDPRKQLFNTYIERMFERSTRSMEAPFTKGQTLHYLCWLASTMVRHNLITYQMESMQPTWLANRSQVRFFRLSSALVGGLFTGLGGAVLGALIGAIGARTGTGLFVRLGFGSTITAFFLGPLFGLIFGVLSTYIHEIDMVDQLKWSWAGFRSYVLHSEWSVRVIILAGLVGLFYGVVVDLRTGLIIALLALGFILILIGSLFGGLSVQKIEETTRPGQRLSQTFANATFVALLLVPFGGIMTGISGGVSTWLEVGLGNRLLLGLLLGLIFWPFLGLGFLQHYTLRSMLARYQFLPWRLVPFLDHAVDLIFLRRVGGSYIFVHRLLMEHFAEM